MKYPPRTLTRIVVASLATFVFHSSWQLARAEEHAIHAFTRLQLTDGYYSEGIGAGDLNGDGKVDIVYGPYWFAGPDFKERREIYPVKTQNKEGYADHFFAWVYDFNGDGFADVLTAGFPGTPGYIYENPGPSGWGTHWKRHQVIDHVSNEAPQFVNIVGDARPELVCTREGYFGYATFDPAKPFEAWVFHPISEKIAPIPFGHGLGVGDINGDGRADIIMKDGWFEQPATISEGTKWVFHPARFAASGGAEMYAYDVDGDGLNDVITSLAAHDFGLAWHQQVREGDKITFKQHIIMGDRAEHNKYGVLFSELHSVALADMDGDGLKDIVTGKTYYSHHKQSPMWDAGAVVYWFKLVRTKEGVDWIPYMADGEAGIGRQLVVADVNGDGLPDLLSGGMKGAHVLLHHREIVDEKRWKEVQPMPKFAAAKPQVRGPQGVIDEKTGRVNGVLEGEELKVVSVTSGKTTRQIMSGFKTGRWSGGEQLFWSGGKAGDRMELELPVAAEGTYGIALALTMARDYGVVQVWLDGEALGEAVDLYNYPDVICSGELTLGKRKLGAGNHKLALEIKGSNPSAVKAFMVGLDYVRLISQ